MNMTSLWFGISLPLGKAESEEPVDWRKCKAVARVLSSCPSQAASVQDYYSLVSPQVSPVVVATSQTHSPRPN